MAERLSRVCERLATKRRLAAIRKQRAAGACQHEAEIGGNVDGDRRRAVHGQRGQAHPEKKATQRRSKPPRPAPRQRAVDRQQAVIDTLDADPDSGKEIDGIEQRAAELHGKRPGIGPLPWRERERHRDIGQRRDSDEDGKIAGRTFARRGRPSAESLERVRRDPIETSDHDIQRQELPEKPQLPIRQERQRQIVLPIGAHARIQRPDPVGRINGQWDQKDDTEDEGQAKSEQAVAQEAPVPLAKEARPHEQPGEQKKKRHQVHVLPSTEQVEAEPAVAVHNRKRTPRIRRIVKAGRGRRRPLDVSQYRVEGEHDQDDHGPQVIEGEAGAGQGGRARHANQIPTSQIDPMACNSIIGTCRGRCKRK